MDFLYILIVVILVIALVYYKKMKNNDVNSSSKVLQKYFKNIDLSNIDTIQKLKEELHIQDLKKYDKKVEVIIDDAEHKYNILLEYRIKNKLLFNNFTFIKIVSNCVIDYSLKKNIHIKESIQLLLVTLESEKISEFLNEERDENQILEDFISLIDGYIIRYNQRENN